MSDGDRRTDGTEPATRPTVAFSRAAYDRVVEHARTGAPAEVCGVLGGPAESGGDGPRADGRRVETALPVANVADAPRTRYELAPEEQLRRIEAIEGDGGAVVGFYHSHPRGPAGPSETDRSLATWPDASYVIVSLAGDEPAVGSWRWTGERFRRETVAVDGA
ncbi:desampylase [Halostella litorea]|uniref:desampylase n=1 Tax=Halostella litorea TaxID=2528831 RepID=UPI001091B8B4|nr:desampylase [Halostella litorea]